MSFRTVRIAGVLGTATVRPHEPWVLDVRIKLPEALDKEVREIPGCGYDGLRKVWVLPVEVVDLLEKEVIK